MTIAAKAPAEANTILVNWRQRVAGRGEHPARRREQIGQQRMQLALFRRSERLFHQIIPDDGTDLRNRAQDPDSDITVLLLKRAESAASRREGARYWSAEIASVEHDNRVNSPQHAALTAAGWFAEPRLP